MQASSLLESIPRMFSQTQHADACLGAAVKASIDTLKVRLPCYFPSLSFPVQVFGCAVFRDHPLCVQHVCGGVAHAVA